MADKTSGKGSIYQLDKGRDGKKPKSKCRRWKLVDSLGKDPKTGKYRQKVRNFNGTWTEAQRELRAFVAEIEGGQVVKRSGWTFNGYAKHYVETRVAAGEIQERTANSHRNNLHALGHLIGEMRLQELTPEVLEQAYIDLRAGESLSGKPLSGRTLYNINLSAHLMFNDAKEKGIMASNPLDKVPMSKKDTKEKVPLTAEAYSALIGKLDPKDRMQCAVLLCAVLGLRRSEAVGLSWGDVDFAEATVNVHASADDHGGVKEPKTEAGYRLLPMPQHLADALMERKREAVPLLLKYAPHKTAQVFSKDGKCPAGAVAT